MSKKDISKKDDAPKNPLVELDEFYKKLKKQWDKNKKQHKELMEEIEKFRAEELKKEKEELIVA